MKFGIGSEVGLQKRNNILGIGREDIGIQISDEIIFGAHQGFTIPSAALTINSITEYPVFRYLGGDNGGVDDTQWPYSNYGLDLSIGGSGALPIQRRYDTEMVPARFYSVPGLQFGNTDGVFEFVLNKKTVGGSVSQFVIGTDTLPGWLLYQAAGDARLRLLLYSGAARTGYTIDLSALTWYHILFFVDRSGSMTSYTNGVQGPVTVVAPLPSTDDTKTIIGGPHQGRAGYDSKIAYAAFWQRADWLDTHLQQAIATARHNKFNLSVLS